MHLPTWPQSQSTEMAEGGACIAPIAIALGSGCRIFHTPKEEGQSLRVLVGMLAAGAVGGQQGVSHRAGQLAGGE